MVRTVLWTTFLSSAIFFLCFLLFLAIFCVCPCVSIDLHNRLALNGPACRWVENNKNQTNERISRIEHEYMVEMAPDSNATFTNIHCSRFLEIHVSDPTKSCRYVS